MVQRAEPIDAAERRAKKPVVVYPVGTLPLPDLTLLRKARETCTQSGHVVVPPRDARTFRVPKGSFFRITCPEGYQVGDLDLWNANELSESFYSGKTRALHGTHVKTGDQLWSSFPSMRPMATITEDSLAWYGFDEDGGSVHDVIGTRCDPYTNRILSQTDYDNCCHSNLVRALSRELGKPAVEVEPFVHDVLNVFMCTGFTKDTHQYFMKASPVRPGDFIELFAEIDLLGALSACPGGDCGSSHSSDSAVCHPLVVDIWTPDKSALGHWESPARSAYPRTHGIEK